MNTFTIISLLLLVQVINDAIGDAFRLKGWQVVHHAVETFQIAGWIVLWAFFGFELQFVVMYIMGRIWLFDIIFNLISGNRLLYVGVSDLVGILIRKLPVPDVHLSFIIKFLALLVWIAGIINQSVG